MKISQRVSKLLSGHNFHSDIFKGALFPKMKVEFKFLLSAHRTIMLYICTKFIENISKCLGVTERTRLSLRNLLRGIIP